MSVHYEVPVIIDNLVRNWRLAPEFRTISISARDRTAIPNLPGSHGESASEPAKRMRSRIRREELSLSGGSYEIASGH